MYLKSICIVSQPLNYDTANNTCVRNGMKLFISNNQQEYDALNSATVGLSGNHYAGAFPLRFWINGKKTTKGWMSYNPLEAAIFSNATWYLNNTSFGSCLTIYLATIFSTPSYIGGDCSLSYHTFCEFS